MEIGKCSLSVFSKNALAIICDEIHGKRMQKIRYYPENGNSLKIKQHRWQAATGAV